MNRRVLILVIGLLVVASACGPNADELEATVVAEVNIAVIATSEAIATVTPAATFTPGATYTPLPTLTPVNTLPPEPTYTPLPTLTPRPTLTSPPPTETPTPTLTPLPTATASEQIQVSAPTTSGSGGLEVISIMLTRGRMDGVLNYFFTRSGPLRTDVSPPRPEWIDRNIACPEALSAYTSFLNSIVSPITTSDEKLQNAYANYEVGVNIFIDTVDEWIMTCQTAVANNTELGQMPNAAQGQILQGTNDAKSYLQQAINILNE